jgi:phosphohistidine phosphatase SixA
MGWMTIYFMRHGYAGAPVRDDPEGERIRPLTDEGLMQVRAVAQEMRDRGMRPSVIYSSSFARATQTADAVGRCFRQGVQVLDRLGPVMPLDRFIKNLLDASGVDGGKKDAALIVGHHDNMEPLFQAMTGKPAGLMMTAEVRSFKVKTNFKKAKERKKERIRASDLGQGFRDLDGLSAPTFDLPPY